MIYSITYGNKNTWSDWKLLAIERPIFVPPEKKTEYLPIEGRDGDLDLSEVLTKHPVYGNRKGTHKFRYVGKRPFSAVYSEILNYLHGENLHAVLSEEPDWYYDGRFFVKDPDYEGIKEVAEIDIDYIVNPYKMQIQSSAEEMLWDNVNFETTIFNETHDIEVRGTKIFTIHGFKKRVVPKFIVSNASGICTISYKSFIYTVNNGENVIGTIILDNGENTITASGNFDLTVDYRGGIL